MKNIAFVLLVLLVLLVPSAHGQEAGPSDYTITPSKHVVFYGEDLYFNITGANGSRVYIDVYNSSSNNRYRRYPAIIDQNGTTQYYIHDIDQYETDNYSVSLFLFGNSSLDSVYLNGTYFKFVFSEYEYTKMRLDKIDHRDDVQEAIINYNRERNEAQDAYIYDIGKVIGIFIFVVSLYLVFHSVVFWPEYRRYLIKMKVMRLRTDVACAEDVLYADIEGDIVDFHLTDDKVREIIKQREKSRTKRLTAVDPELVEEIDRIDREYKKEMSSFIALVKSHPIVTGRRSYLELRKNLKEKKEAEKENDEASKKLLEGE